MAIRPAGQQWGFFNTINRKRASSVPFTILCEPHHRARSESVANAARTFEINPKRPLAKLSVYDRFAPVFAIRALLRASQKQMFARRARRTTIRKPR
jgi:hypothetical protein